MEKIVEFFNYKYLSIDENLLINFAPILATILATIVALIIIIQKLRLRWPTTVNCWFCNVNTKIWRSENDWWKCKSCHQYNGFSKDGDYNYDIPEQRKKSLNKQNFKSYFSSVKSQSSNVDNRTNGLCTKCNNNEQKKLNEMQSIDTDNWRQCDIDNLKKNLEIKYQLCRKCDEYVQNFLQKQSKWLTQYKMLFFKKNPTDLIVKHFGKFEYYGRFFLTILSAAVIYYHTLQPLPLFGALIQLIIVAKRINSNGTFDALLTLVWLAIFGLMPIHHLKLYRLAINNSLFTMEYITSYQIITILSTTVGFFNATSRTTSSSNPNLSFKKLDNTIDDSLNSTTEISDVSQRNDDEIITNRRSPVNITHLLTSTNNLPAPAPIKPSISPNLRICDSQQGSSPISMTICPDQHDKFDLPSKKTLTESMKNFSSLSLSNPNKKQILKSPKIFETKQYGTTSPDLFRYNNSYNKLSGKNFILAPPKFKPTSWVAGGYWQMGMNPSTLSRSSSQSSGFGSTGSNFGQSREPSVVNDIDRCSVLSDTTVYCHSTQNINSTNSSCCSHLSSCRISNPNNSSTCFLQPQTICHNNYQYSNDWIINRSSSQSSTQEIPVCSNHSTNSVTTNSSWLPALVCGSIFLNIVVFCTVLMR